MLEVRDPFVLATPLEQSFNSLHAQREACQAFVLSQRQEGWHTNETPCDDGGYADGSVRDAVDFVLQLHLNGISARSPSSIRGLAAPDDCLDDLRRQDATSASGAFSSIRARK